MLFLRFDTKNSISFKKASANICGTKLIVPVLIQNYGIYDHSQGNLLRLVSNYNSTFTMEVAKLIKFLFLVLFDIWSHFTYKRKFRDCR